MVKHSNPSELAKLKSHFANLCQLAMADAILNKQEAEYLDGLCKQYGLTKTDFNEIMDNAYGIEFVSPETPLARLEQMYDLVRMVLMDEIDISRLKLAM